MNKEELYIRNLLEEDLDKYFYLLFENYKYEILRIACNMIKSREDAEDIRQEVFMSAYEYLARHGVASVLSLHTWLCRITINKCKKRFDTIKKEYYSNKYTSLDTIAGGDLAETLADTQRFSQTEEVLIAQETRENILDAIGSLPESYRQVILKYIQGYSCYEIAQQLDRSQGTVRVQIHRGLRLLRDVLVDDINDKNHAS